MPATYTTSLRFVKPANGDLSWGETVNDGFTTLADNSIAGKSTITLATTSHTLSNNNGAADEARSMFLEITGAPGGAADIICPAVSKLYIISNTVTGGFAVTLKTAAGTGISVPNGKTMILRCDGTNVVDAITNFSSLAVNNDTVVTLAATQTLTNKTFNLASNTLTGTLPQANGGTGKASWSANRVVYTNASNTISESSSFTYTSTTATLRINSIFIGPGANNISSNVTLGGSTNLSSNTTGTYNIAIGASGALNYNTTGSENIAVGLSPLTLNSTGSRNIAIGSETLSADSACSNNVVIGHYAAQSTIGNENVIIGDNTANFLGSGAKNTIIGKSAASTFEQGDNLIVIGYSAEPSSNFVSNQITLGNSSITAFRVPGLSWTGGVKYINLGVLTVATLPAAATAGAGARAFVSDANATTFASVVAGGGANNIPVYSDGTNWRIG